MLCRVLETLVDGGTLRTSSQRKMPRALFHSKAADKIRVMCGHIRKLALGVAGKVIEPKLMALVDMIQFESARLIGAK